MVILSHVLLSNHLTVLLGGFDDFLFLFFFGFGKILANAGISFFIPSVVLFNCERTNETMRKEVKKPYIE